jgi:hypothetical protein
MSLTSADEKVIKRIKEGEHKAYPEDRYVDPAIIPGGVVTFLSLTFLLFSFIFPDGGSIPFEFAMIGTLIGISLLIPGITVWYYFRTVYSYLGLRRFQVALSITALELSNHEYRNVESIISPHYPSEYEYLTLFTSIGPGTLLKRMGGVHWDSETLTKMIRQAERFTVSMTGLSGGLAFLGSLILLPVYFLLFLMSGTHNIFLISLGVLLFIMGTLMILHTRRKIRVLNEVEPLSSESVDVAQIADISSPKCSVEDVLSLIRLGYSHPIRLLMLETYRALEYTGKVYHTGDGIELREAYLLPAFSGN